MLWNPYEYQRRSYKILRILDINAMESILIGNKILQDPTRSYKILQDTIQKCFQIHINSKQDKTRFYAIVDKNPMESIPIANKILQDPARSYKILQDPTRFYGILDKNVTESMSIANKILQNPTTS